MVQLVLAASLIQQGGQGGTRPLGFVAMVVGLLLLAVFLLGRKRRP